MICGLARTRLMLARCQKEPQIGLSSQVFKAGIASFDDWVQKSDKEDQANAFDALKGRITQKIGTRIDKSKQNGFKLFGMEEKFDIDKMKLQREMRKLQNLLHPDRFVGRNTSTQSISLELSAMVNDFYHTISHPYERGKYLLSLMTNKNQDELEKSLGSIQLDGEFLARMMDISERAQDPHSDRSEMAKLTAELDAEMAKLTRDLKANFEAKRFNNIYRDLAKLKFLANCHTSLTDHAAPLDGDF